MTYKVKPWQATTFEGKGCPGFHSRELVQPLSQFSV